MLLHVRPNVTLSDWRRSYRLPWVKTDEGPVHTTTVKFENATIAGHFGFVFKENSVREIT